MKKSMKIISTILLLTSIILLGLAAYFYTKQENFIETSIKTSGVVIGLEESTSSSSSSSSISYAPTVKYQDAEGNEYVFTSNISSSPPSYDVGEEVIIMYNPNNPSDAQIKSIFGQWIIVWILGGIGGIHFITLRIRKKKKIQYLKDYGVCLKTTFDRVERITNVKINGKNPYRVYSTLSDFGTNYVFKSSKIMYDPTSLIKNNEIIVYAERRNYSKYVMIIE